LTTFRNLIGHGDWSWSAPGVATILGDD